LKAALSTVNTTDGFSKREFVVFQEAGIDCWMLTGDKAETAIQVRQALISGVSAILVRKPA
jgi:hypothetical protein